MTVTCNIKKRCLRGILFLTFIFLNYGICFAGEFTPLLAKSGILQPIKRYVLPHCIRPSGDFAPQITEELSRSRLCIKRLNLQNKPLLFANKKSIFNHKIATTFIKSLPDTLEILDLSENRFPQETLTTFSELITRGSFHFLDVRINSGADTIEALHQLNQLLLKGKLRDPAAILAKVIWVPRDHLDALKEVGLLKERYYKAHQAYDQLFREEPTEWELPD